MAIRNLPPLTPGQRGMSVADFAEITRDRPEKSLTRGKKSTGGRNNAGRITSRFRGGGAKRCLRDIDFLRAKEGVPAQVRHLEYDPNRSANLALLEYADGEKAYILAPVGLAVGATVMSGKDAEIKPGNCKRLRDIPAGIDLHNLEVRPGGGARLVRAAGQVAQLRAKEGDYAQVRLPSGEVRLLHVDCRATIGQVGNLEHGGIKLGKAGRKRHLGRRPHNRGVVMNPVDHPMGGGEGRSSGGGHPRSPWGQLAKGKKTRRPNRPSDNFILERRKKK